jgi:phage-related tail protein
MLRTIAIAISAMLALGAYASKSYIAGVLLTLLAIGLLACRKQRNRQPLATTSADDKYEQILRNRDDLVEYYAFMQAMQDAEKAHDFDKMLLYVEKTIPVLHKFVDDTKKAFDSFDIGSIPAIDLACRYWAVLGERENLQQLKIVLEQKNELKKWASSVQAALEDADLADRLQTYLKMNPRSLQNQLGKMLGVSGRDTARIVATLEKLGKVRRVADGKTYKVHVTES